MLRDEILSLMSDGATRSTSEVATTLGRTITDTRRALQGADCLLRIKAPPRFVRSALAGAEKGRFPLWKLDPNYYARHARKTS